MTRSKREILKQLTDALNDVAADDNGCDYMAIVDFSPSIEANQAIRTESVIRQGRSLKRSEVMEFIRQQRNAYGRSKFKERGVEAEHAFLLAGTPLDNLFILYASELPGEYQNLKMISSLKRKEIEGLLLELAG